MSVDCWSLMATHPPREIFSSGKMAPGPFEMCFINSWPLPLAKWNMQTWEINVVVHKLPTVCLGFAYQTTQDNDKGQGGTVEDGDGVGQQLSNPQIPDPRTPITDPRSPPVPIYSSSLRLLFLTCFLWVIGPASTSPTRAKLVATASPFTINNFLVFCVGLELLILALSHNLNLRLPLDYRPGTLIH